MRAYTGRTDTAEREESENAAKDNQVKALVATPRSGMGFDKPDLGFVLHLGAPSSPVAYYQQVGRAGRAAANADVLLLPGVEDEASGSTSPPRRCPTRRAPRRCCGPRRRVRAAVHAGAGGPGRSAAHAAGAAAEGAGR